MLTRRTLLAASTSIAMAPPLRAATPREILIVAKQIDDLTSLDPHESFEASGGEITGNLYQRLVIPDPKDPSRLQGELAESWSVSEDGLTHRFVLRPDAVFASGKPVTQADAVFSLRRAIQMNKAPAFILGQFGLTPGNVAERIRTGGDRIVLLQTAERQAPSFVLYCLTAQVAGVVERDLVLSHAAGDDLGNAWLRQNSAGSGPLTLRSWRAGESVMLDRNPRHPAAGAGSRPAISRVVIRHVADPTAQLLLLQQGDADIARNLSSDQLRGIAGTPGLRLVHGERSILMYLALNASHPTLARPEVRQAIKWAVDYDGIQRNLAPQTWKVHQSFLPDGMPGALADTPFHKDVGRARALLAEAGLAEGFEITIDHPANPPYAEIAQAVQANLAEVGIRAELLAGDQRQIITKTRARQHQAALLYWGSDYFDPNSNAQAFCVNPDNGDAAAMRTVAWRNHWQDAALSARAAANAREADTAKRLDEYRSLQRESRERDPFVLLLQQVEVAATRGEVAGFVLGGLANVTAYAAVTKAG